MDIKNRIVFVHPTETPKPPKKVKKTEKKSTGKGKTKSSKESKAMEISTSPASIDHPSAESTSTTSSNSELKQKIIAYIKAHDQGDGIKIAVLSQALGESESNLSPIIEQMVKDIDLFKAQPDCYSAY